MMMKKDILSRNYNLISEISNMMMIKKERLDFLDSFFYQILNFTQFAIRISISQLLLDTEEREKCNEILFISGLWFSFFIIYFMFPTDIWPVISCVLLLLLLLSNNF